MVVYLAVCIIHNKVVSQQWVGGVGREAVASLQAGRAARYCALRALELLERPTPFFELEGKKGSEVL